MRELHELVIAEGLQGESLLHAPGIGTHDSVHVGPDFHRLCGEYGPEQCGGVVGPTSAKRCYVSLYSDPLETGNGDDLTCIQMLLNQLGVNILDPGLGVHVIGADCNLIAKQGYGIGSALFNSHGKESDGDLFPGRQQHVHFPAVGDFLYVLGKAG